MAKQKLDKSITNLTQAEVEGFFVLKTDDGAAIGDPADFLYFADQDKKFLQGSD